MMGFDGYGYRMMGAGWGWIMMIVILAIIVIAVLAAVRYLQRTNRTNFHPSHNGAIDILNERYARGEISDEEYKRKKAEIKT